MENHGSDEASDDQDHDIKGESKAHEFEDLDVSRLLRRIGEESLIPLLSEQRVTMEMLMDLSHADLREVGVDIFGQRHKILAEIARLKQGKCTSIYSKNFIYYIDYNVFLYNYISATKCNIDMTNMYHIVLINMCQMRIDRHGSLAI
jgi:hypothetical protein